MLETQDKTIDMSGTGPTSSPLTDRVIGVAMFAAILTVYLRTMCPTLYWGDCGELATAAYNLAITHPTGYPVWCLLAKTWTYLVPHGTIIWRLNTMSAFFGALAATCFFRSLRYWGLPRSIAVAAAGMLAFSFTLWQQSLFCETYSMTAFYTCLLLMLTARWNARGRTTGDLRLLAIGYGFAMTNHQTNTLFLPGFVTFILWNDPQLRQLRDPSIRRRWLSILGPGMAPLLFYLYLPIRAMAKPPNSWGYPVTPYQVFYHITGRSYSNLMFHAPLKAVWSTLMQWALGLGREFHWVYIGVAAAGLAVLWARSERRPFAFLLTWIMVADIVYTINYFIYNQYIYFIPSYIVIATAGAIGLAAAWQMMERAIEPNRRLAFANLGAACLMLAPVFQAVRHWHFDDLSQNWTCYDYARNLLSTMPRGSLVVDNGKDTSAFTIGYLQSVESYRTDVTLIRRGTLHGIYDPVHKGFMNI